VTVDGAPGAGLVVTFEPQREIGAKDVGQPSSATSDASGKYELIYPGGGKGAVVGRHLVRISNAKGGESAIAADPDAGAESSIIVPAKYNVESTMMHEVKPGPNTIDIPITAK
jgi:hypothetical protein